MSNPLAVDTNVFLLASHDAGCNEVLRRVLHVPDFALLIDPKKEIWKEYRDYARRFPQSLLSELVRKIIDQDKQHSNHLDPSGLPLTLDMKGVSLDANDVAFLESLSCEKPIEPQLFSIVSNQPTAKLVIVGDTKTTIEPIKRGYRQGHLPSIVSKLNIRIVHTDDIQWLSEVGSPLPSDEQTLHALLEKHRLDANCVERDFVEVKCSKLPSRGLSPVLLKKVMEAVCAMTNSVSGYIFVGVDEDGKIHGLSKEYDGTPLSSWDALWLKFTSEMGNFSPHKPVFNQWWIPIKSDGGRDLAVCALRVYKQRGGNISYRREVFLRQGTASVKKSNRS